MDALALTSCMAVAERLGVTEEQVGAIALDYLLQATEKKQTVPGQEEPPLTVAQE